MSGDIFGSKFPYKSHVNFDKLNIR